MTHVLQTTATCDQANDARPVLKVIANQGIVAQARW